MGAVLLGAASSVADGDVVTEVDGRFVHSLTQREAASAVAQSRVGAGLTGAGILLAAGGGLAFAFDW